MVGDELRLVLTNIDDSAGLGRRQPARAQRSGQHPRQHRSDGRSRTRGWPSTWRKLGPAKTAADHAGHGGDRAGGRSRVLTTRRERRHRQRASSGSRTPDRRRAARSCRACSPTPAGGSLVLADPGTDAGQRHGAGGLGQRHVHPDRRSNSLVVTPSSVLSLDVTSALADHPGSAAGHRGPAGPGRGVAGVSAVNSARSPTSRGPARRANLTGTAVLPVVPIDQQGQARRRALPVGGAWRRHGHRHADGCAGIRRAGGPPVRLDVPAGTTVTADLGQAARRGRRQPQRTVDADPAVGQ